MSIHVYPFNLPSVAELSEAQMDGQECVYCGAPEGVMKPVGRIRGCQVFAHVECASGHKWEES